jgi:hypothetical protein
MVLLMRGFHDDTIEIASCDVINLPSFLKIGTGIQKILRLRVRNLKGFNVDITDGRDL